MTLTVAALQYCASDDTAATLAHIEPLIAKAARTARLICLPEAASFLAASRAQLFERAEWEDNSASQRKLAVLARQHNVWLLAGSLFLRRRQDHKLVNRGVLFAPDGQVIANYDKIHMYDVVLSKKEKYFESKSFYPGSKIKTFKLPWGKIGLSICYDLRFPSLYRKLAKAGSLFLTVPSAFTETTGKKHWHSLLRARAIENFCYIFAPAQGGTHYNGRKTFGHSLIISPDGEILKELKKSEGVITASINPKLSKNLRLRIPSLKSH